MTVARAAEETSGANVARWSLWAFVGQGLPQFYVLVASAFIARYLGAATFGRISLIVTVQLAMLAFFPLGVPTTSVRFFGTLLGEGRLAEVRGLYRWTWSRMLVLSLLATATMLAIVLFGAEPAEAWLIAAFVTFFVILHSAPSALLQGAQRWREARIVGMVAGGVAMVAKASAAVGGAGISAFFVIDLCLGVVTLTGTTLLAWRIARRWPLARAPRELKAELRRFSLISAVTIVVSYVVYQRVEVFVLAHYKGDTAVAHYTVPFSLTTALLLLPTAVTTVLTPAFATLWGRGAHEALARGYGRAVRLVGLVTLVLVGAVIAVGGNLVQVIYGPEFANLRLVISLLALSVPLLPLATISTSLLRAAGILWPPTVGGIVAAMVDIGLAFLLIPKFGPVGAAAASSLAQVTLAVPLLLYAGRRVHGSSIGGQYLLRTVVVTGIAGAVALVPAVRLGPGMGLVVGLVVYALLVVVGARVLRPLLRDDAWWIVELVPARLGSHVPRVLQAVSG